MIDGTGIAVGAGPSLFIYKNFKPFYKYTTPPHGVNNDEEVMKACQLIGSFFVSMSTLYMESVRIE